VNNAVQTLEARDTVLYVGGNFSHAGGIEVNRIAKWDGTSWSALGDGIAGPFPRITAIAFKDSIIYAGGLFDTAGIVAANSIASWDGLNWSSLGSGLTGLTYNEVDALCVFNGSLYVSGSFLQAGSVSARFIAKWNGMDWSCLSTGVRENIGGISDMAALDSILYMVGGFRYVGDFVYSSRIVGWKGTGICNYDMFYLPSNQDTLYLEDQALDGIYIADEHISVNSNTQVIGNTILQAPSILLGPGFTVLMNILFETYTDSD
jgi:hypothetical protein